MAKKKDVKKFDIWIRRNYLFTAEIEADSLEGALIIAKNMKADELLNAPGETIESDHRITAVLEA